METKSKVIVVIMPPSASGISVRFVCRSYVIGCGDSIVRRFMWILVDLVIFNNLAKPDINYTHGSNQQSLLPWRWYATA